MKVILKREFDDLLKKDWIFLEKKNDPLIFQTLLWNLNWVDQNTKNNNLFIFTVYDNKTPVIIFPFCLIKKFNIKILRWVGYDISDYLGPLTNNDYKIENKDFKTIWDSIFNLIKNECDFIFLDKQNNERFLLNNPIINNLDCVKYDETYGTDLSRWADIKKKKGRALQKFRWAKKKLSEIGELKFIGEIKDNYERKNSIKKIIRWKKEQKEKLNFSQSFSEKFYSNFLSNKNIVISGLKLNNEYIALSLGFTYNQIYFYLVPSYKNNPNLIKYSPGKVLMIDLLDYFKDKKYKYFDFCNGKESYKENWTNNSINLYEYTKQINFLGLLLRLLLKIKKL